MRTSPPRRLPLAPFLLLLLTLLWPPRPAAAAGAGGPGPSPWVALRGAAGSRKASPAEQEAAAAGLLRRLLPSHARSFSFQIDSKGTVCGQSSCFRISNALDGSGNGGAEILKYEEVSPPNVEDFCYITDNTYTKQELVKMESDVLNVLKFELGNPTPKTFLRMFIRSAQEDSNKYPGLQLEYLGSYLCELSLLDYSLLRFLPSLVAASVVFVARLTLDPHTHPWSKKMQTLTGYKPSELKDCVGVLHHLQLNRKFSSMIAIRDKYKQHRFKGVSALLPPVDIPASYFRKLKE